MRAPCAVPSWRGREKKLGSICASWEVERGPGYASKIDLNGRVVVSIFGAEKRPRPPGHVTRLPTTRQPQQGWASQAGPKSLNRVAIFRTKPSRGFALQRSCRGDLPNMEHDMSTSAPARVKTILVVDLTHALNDPFGTTILRDLRD